MEAWRITSVVAAFLFPFLLSTAVRSDGVTCSFFFEEVVLHVRGSVCYYGQTLKSLC